MYNIVPVHVRQIQIILMRIKKIFHADPNYFDEDPNYFNADRDQFEAGPDHFEADPDHCKAVPDHFEAREPVQTAADSVHRQTGSVGYLVQRCLCEFDGGSTAAVDEEGVHLLCQL